MTWIFLGWMLSRLFVLGIDPVSPVSDGTVALDGTGGQQAQVMDGGVGQPPRALDGGVGQPPRF